MKITSKLLQNWEQRLPDLDSPWSHWWLEGEGVCLGVFPYENMTNALDCVAMNHERFSSIKAYRAKIDHDGNPVRQENYVYEISNRINDRE